MKAAAPMIGLGVYGLSEVARYAELNPQRVRAWFTTRPWGVRGGPLFLSDYRIIDNYYGVSFMDLIDTLVAGHLREAGVSMRKVRAVYERLKEQLDTDHPFCHHRLFTDGSEIIIDVVSTMGDEMLSEVMSRQQLFRQAEVFLRRVDYSEESKLAERWHISDGVVIDPAISLGKPVVKATGTTTYVVARSYMANGRNAAFVGDLFGISDTDVLHAFGFEERYGRLPAA